MSKIRDMASWRQNLGDQIREAREARKWTQEQLAKRIGLSRATLNYYECGTAKKLSLEKVFKIAQELQTSFAVSGCTLSGIPSIKASRPPIEQFSLEFEKERFFADVTLSIRPTKEGVLLITTKAKTA
jgi:transcriptional regulator with XRE-family HTH domain